MSDEFDFDKYWLKVFSMCLDDEIGEENRTKVLEGSKKISAESDREDVFQWTKEALKRLDNVADEDSKKRILVGCSCQYPRSNLKELKELYSQTRDVVQVHQKMQDNFEIFLSETLKLEETYTQEIISRKMGMAGELREDRIIATKIPKSAFIKNWFEENDAEKRRAIYCHCPRIRGAMSNFENELPMYHCYCGAGFYKGIWEEILQQPVKVKVLETVMNSGDVCKIAIYLPDEF